jgi:hypothetical protein
MPHTSALPCCPCMQLSALLTARPAQLARLLQAVSAHASCEMSEIAALQVVTVCRGHHMPVYTVRWNLLHTRTFLSCGADWALKVWDESKPKKVTSADN